MEIAAEIPSTKASAELLRTSEPDERAQVSHAGAGNDNLVAEQISKLLKEAGIKPHHWVNFLANAMNVNAKTARRKIEGESDFTVTELRLTLAALNYSYDGIYGCRAGLDAPSDVGPIDVNVQFAGRECTARVKVRKDARPAPAATGEVLLHDVEAGGYRIAKMSDVPPGAEVYLIESIEILQPFKYEGSGATVGVFNTDANAATSVSQGLYRSGFNALPMSTLQDLWTALERSNLEAVLLNWTSWSEWDPTEVSSRIRAKCPDSPIIFCAGLDDDENPSLVRAADMTNALILPALQGTQVITRHLLRELRRPKG